MLLCSISHAYSTAIIAASVAASNANRISHSHYYDYKRKKTYRSNCINQYKNTMITTSDTLYSEEGICQDTTIEPSKGPQ